MYPRVLVSKEKLRKNTEVIAKKAKDQGIALFVVTKVFCGNPEIATICLEAGASGLADSRIENLKRMAHLKAEKMLLRLPMLSEVAEVVAYADISLNSEVKTIKALDKAANAVGKKHGVLLMVDLGDLREGILPKDLDETVHFIKTLSSIELVGIGVNLTCYGGVIPNATNLGELESLAKRASEILGHPLRFISGGNSSSLYLLDNGEMPRMVNQLRVGEAVCLGRETAYGDAIASTYDDAFLLEAELIELKEKGSVPIGEIGMDAFGNKPVFEDKGQILRGILAVGQQDLEASGLVPVDEGVEILGASSDHMLLNLSKARASYELGSILQFKMGYGAMLKLFTSPYVTKTIL